MNKNILFILLLLIFLSAFSYVDAADLDNSTLEYGLDQNNITAVAIESENTLSASQNDTDVLTTDLQNNDSDVLTSNSKENTDSSSYLIIDKDADVENVYIGDYVTWVVSVINKGPGIAKNVKVFDQLPYGLKYVKHTTSKGIYDPKTGIWDIGDLSVDDNEVFLYITTLAVSVGEKINKANLTCDSNNLNNETYEEEEIDVFADEKTYNNSKSCSQSSLKATGNPLFLLLLSLFGCLICNNKKS